MPRRGFEVGVGLTHRCATQGRLVPSHRCSGSGTNVIPTAPFDAPERESLSRAVTSHPPGILDRLICVDDAEPRVTPARFISRDRTSTKSRDPSVGGTFRAASSCARAELWIDKVVASPRTTTVSMPEATITDFIEHLSRYLEGVGQQSRSCQRTYEDNRFRR